MKALFLSLATLDVIVAHLNTLVKYGAETPLLQWALTVVGLLLAIWIFSAEYRKLK